MPRITGRTPAFVSSVLAAAFISVIPATAQLNHGCPALGANDFKMTTVIARSTGIDEPIKMALDADAQGNVDIYFVERMGGVKKYSGATKAVTQLATIPIWNGYEDGLTGIALDPGFKTNGWMYLYWGKGTSEKLYAFRVSRFTLKDGKLDMASEKAVLEIPANGTKMHTGGAMTFDGAGDLWITTGENQAGEVGTSNTNDLRGKVLRIHPTPEGSYTVPAGNLFAPGTAKTKPEIYVMGARNPYSISLDVKRHAVTWGDIGPDGQGITEEYNYTQVPGNFGYPYFAGNNIKLTGTGTADQPINANGQNTGLTNLPKAIPAMVSYKQEAAVTGPIYYYDGHLKSDVKMPPHFDGLWFVTDFQTGTMDTVRMNPAGTAVVAQGRVFPTFKVDRPIDMKMGPDGALYVIQYAGWFNAGTTTGILRIDYSGTCRPELPTAVVPSLMRNPGFRSMGMSIDITAPGHHALRVSDLRGRCLADFGGEGAHRYDLAAVLAHRGGTYLVRLETSRGTESRRVVLAE